MNRENNQEVSPFVFRGEYNDESTYMPYDEIAEAAIPYKDNNDYLKNAPVGGEVGKTNSNEGQKEYLKFFADQGIIDCSAYVPNDSAGYIEYDSTDNVSYSTGDKKWSGDKEETTEGTLNFPRLKVGDKVMISSESSVFNWRRAAHGKCCIVKERLKSGMYLVSGNNESWGEANLIRLDDSTPVPSIAMSPLEPNEDNYSHPRGSITAKEFASLKVGDMVKIASIELLGLWGRYHAGFCGKWVVVSETCPQRRHIVAKNDNGCYFIAGLSAIEAIKKGQE